MAIHPVHTLKTLFPTLLAVAGYPVPYFNGTGTHLASGGDDNTVRIWK